VRALEPVEGLDFMRQRRPRARNESDLTNGPGKLCAALGITGDHNGLPLNAAPLTILRDREVPDSRVRVTPRVGITRAADWPLRWHIADNPWVSRAPRRLPSGLRT
jgi:DNA-3-methyladenine glycosylase